VTGNRKQLAELQQAFFDCYVNHHCLAGPFDGRCPNAPVNSHSLAQRWLKTITRNGHAYVPKMNFLEAKSDSAFITLELKGIRKATAYPLFSAEHDRKLFQSLESQPFATSPTNALMLHFRAVAREMYSKVGANIVSKTIQVRFDDTPEGVMARVEHEALVRGQMLGLMDISQQYTPLLELALAQNASSIRYYICKFRRPLPVAFMGAFMPEFSLDGEKLVDYDLDELPNECVAVSCFGDGSSGYVAITWNSGCNLSRKFARSFHRVPHEKKSQAAIVVGLEHIENIAVSPSWWESLSKTQQRTILDHIASGSMINPVRSPQSFELGASLPFEAEFAELATNEGLIAITL